MTQYPLVQFLLWYYDPPEGTYRDEWLSLMHRVIGWRRGWRRIPSIFD